MSFDRDYYSFLCHLETSEFIGTQRQIMVIYPFVEDFQVFRSRLLQSPLPSGDKRVRWHTKTNYGHLPILSKTSMSFDRDYYNLLCHPEISESVGTQRQIVVICLFCRRLPCLSIETITVSFAIQRQASLLACRDKLWSSAHFVEDFHVFRSRLLQSYLPSRDKRVCWHAGTNYGHLPILSKTSMSFDRDYYSLLCHPKTSEFVGTKRQIIVSVAIQDYCSLCCYPETIVVFVAIQRQSSPMACGNHHGCPFSLLSRPQGFY